MGIYLTPVSACSWLPMFVIIRAGKNIRTHSALICFVLSLESISNWAAITPYRMTRSTDSEA